MSQNTNQNKNSKEEANVNESGSAVILLLSNIPYDCRADYLTLWIEARGFRVSKLSLIQDAVSETSPSFAHVQLMHAGRAQEAARALSGQHLNGRSIQVKVLVPRKWQSQEPRTLKVAV